MAISIFLPAHYILAGILMYASIINFVDAFRSKRKGASLSFGLLCAMAAILSIINAYGFEAVDIELMAFYNKLSISITFIMLGVLTLFFSYITKYFRWKFAIALSACVFVLSVLNMTFEHSFLYREISAIKIIHLPWGEAVLLPAMNRTRYAFFIIGGVVSVYSFSIYCSVHNYRRYRRRLYFWVAVSLLASLGFIVQGALARLGVIHFPPLGAFGGLAMILIMHFLLAQDEYQRLKLNRLIHENSVEALVVVDIDGRITLVNHAFEEITGLSREDIVGQDIVSLRAMGEDKEIFKEIDAALQNQGSWQGEIRNRRKNGSYFEIFAKINKVFDDFGAETGRVILFVDITDKKKADADIWHHANYDALTGLANRELLADRLAVEMRNALATGTVVAVLHTDLDHFKALNEAGQAFGDLALRKVSERLCGSLEGNGFVGRFAGDQFMVVVPGFKCVGDVETFLGKLFRNIAKPYDLGDRSYVITQSVGVALFPSDAEDAGKLLDRAQLAMGIARRDGGNCYRFYAPQIQADASERFLMNSEMRLAIQKNQFELFYQPIVDLASGHILKAEALLRWHHPRHGLLGPMRFIKLAEESGFIGELGDWVMAEAGRQLARWSARFPNLQVSINISPAQFHQSAHHNGAQLAAPTLDMLHSNMCIEITESTLADERFGEVLTLYRGSGVEIAIDDFGTGYSSLSYLRKFRIHYLKIDRSFVQELDTSATDRSICEAIIVMAHKLGIKVIAEGIETQSQLDRLSIAGCDYGQGFLFSRPVPALELEKFMAAWISEQRYAGLVGSDVVLDLASMRA